MSVRTLCSSCGAKLRIPSKLIGTGTPLTCPRCGALITRIEEPAPNPLPQLATPPVRIPGTSCPGCGRRVPLADDDWGGVIECRECNTAFVPGTGEVIQRATPIQAPYPVARGQAFTPATPEVPAATHCLGCGRPLHGRVPCFDCDADFCSEVCLCRHQRRTGHGRAAGREPASQSVEVNTTVIVPRRFPHEIHLVMTVLTCGLWLPIWILHYLMSSS